MKKKKRWLSAIAAVALLLLVAACLFFAGGTNNENIAYAESDSYLLDNNFEFTQIDVEITVGKDKRYKVKETLDTKFFMSNVNRGIIRDIQHQTTTTRYINGNKIKGKSFIATLSDVSAKFNGTPIRTDIEVSRDAYSVYMRNPGGYIDAGNCVFELEYTYSMCDDKMAGYDDFIFDVLGYEMNLTKTLNATVTFPDDVNLNDVSVRTNIRSGSSTIISWNPSAGDESFAISGNVITLTACPNHSSKGYTLQVILPDGYFSEASLTFYWYYIIVIVAVAAGIVFAALLFWRFASQGKALEVVEFYPPEGLSVMEFSSIWHRGARAKDSAALILKWANAGLITIEKDGDKNLILHPTGVVPVDGAYSKKKKNDDIFSDFSDDDDEDEEEETVKKKVQFKRSDTKYFDNIAEKMFFLRLFSGVGGDGYFSTRIFKNSSSYNKRQVYSDVDELVERGGDRQNLVGKAEKVRCALPFIGLIPTLALIVYYCVLCSDFLPMFFFIFMAAGTFVGVMWRKTPQVVLMIIFPIVFYGVIYGVFSGLFALTAYDYCYFIYIAPIVWAVCLFVLPFFVKGKRTPKAQEMYGRLKGFKNFLLKAELPRIQLLFDENPEYFSDILAWCFIMGISEKVEKRFKSLSFNPPKYLQQGVSVYWIGHCMRHSCCRRTVVIPTSHSGGGGGFSFGGGGGGHGGSSGGGGGGGGSRGC